ncbi:MAG: hypothetical protein IJN00_05280, partial [Clostridia bacterium]|nr:hypothetical protein [Clostridia bacterium]
MIRYASPGRAMKMLFSILLALLVCLLILPTASYAQETAQETAGQEEDVGVTSPLTPKEGEAAIVEHDTGEGENQVGEILEEVKALDPTAEDLVFENDLPSYTHTVEKNVVSGETVSDIYTLTETGQIIELPENAPVPDDVQSEVLEPLGDVQTTVTVTNSDNAIQKAVEKALTALDADSKSVTVSVAAGEYDGDIVVYSSAFAGGVDWDEFTLYILAEDSYEAPETEDGLIDKDQITANSEGKAHVNGNITVEGINVVLAGLYMALDKIITAKDASVDVYGTAGNDSINITLSGDASANVYGGEGNDTVTVTGTGGASDSEDENSAYNTENEVGIYGGEGDDTMIVDIAAANNTPKVEADGGEGTDRLHFTGSLMKDGEGSTVEYDALGSPVIELKNSDENLVKMTVANVENFTDALKNKKEVEVTIDCLKTDENGKTVIVINTDNTPFVNYTIDTHYRGHKNAVLFVANEYGFPSGIIEKGAVVNPESEEDLRAFLGAQYENMQALIEKGLLIFTDADRYSFGEESDRENDIPDFKLYDITVAGSGLLSGLVIVDGAINLGSDIAGAIGKQIGGYTVGSIDAPELNITLEGVRIAIEGTVNGNNITVTAHDDDKTLP